MQQPKPVDSQKTRRLATRWQPLLLALGGLMLITVAFLSLSSRSPGTSAIEVRGAPSLKADQERIDLGEIKIDQPAQASFTLTNVGDETLRFTKAPYIEVVEGC